MTFSRGSSSPRPELDLSDFDLSFEDQEAGYAVLLEQTPQASVPELDAEFFALFDSPLQDDFNFQLTETRASADFAQAPMNCVHSTPSSPLVGLVLHDFMSLTATFSPALSPASSPASSQVSTLRHIDADAVSASSAQAIGKELKKPKARKSKPTQTDLDAYVPYLASLQCPARPLTRDSNWPAELFTMEVPLMNAWGRLHGLTELERKELGEARRRVNNRKDQQAKRDRTKASLRT